MARNPPDSDVDRLYISGQPTPLISNAGVGTVDLKNQDSGALFFVRGRTRVSKNSMIREQPS